MEKVLIVKDKCNKNGVVYSKKALNSIVKQINNGEYNYGELNPDYINNLVDVKNISHKYSNAEIVNENVFVEIDILDTPSGKILEKLVDWDKFGVRGTGIIKNNTIKEIKLISIDFIA